MLRPLLVLLLAAAGAGVRAAPTPEPVVLEHAEKYRLKADGIDQTFGLLVSLPADYATSGKRYPVLYVLDGWHFPLLAFLAENNLYSGRMPPLIIVDIDHGEVPNVMDLRVRDFTPVAIPKFPQSGGGPRFLAFLERQVIPFIDRTYRTDPGDRGLLGHSLGGSFALYALVERPALFQRVVAASPALFLDGDATTAAARVKLAAGLPGPVRLDLSAGDGEPLEVSINRSTRAFVAMLDALKPARLTYRFTAFPGENHNSVRLPSFPHGLYWVYQP